MEIFLRLVFRSESNDTEAGGYLGMACISYCIFSISLVIGYVNNKLAHYHFGWVVTS